ncbi:hypothetical protein QT381_11265 [Galbitalea sp. SE-J8]|uniref:hypothetical protein n=1 Tax=Galbitalea sp. SE-J8 TaxID=3054952 RepID=UPI00259CD918|nr:hypothetical protein [Galbitalea sp. SE-J8]MDM4763588.1 hypothetical protein [Galbitalea sp. SE-J8]
MDALLGHDRSAELHASAWASPDRGLWVATADGCYHGMVERVGAVYRAIDDRGVVAGEFDTLGEAQRALHAAQSIDLGERYAKGAAA